MDGQQVATILVTVFASTGFWTFVRTVYEHWIDKKKESKQVVSYELFDALRKAILGVMHAMIFSLGNEYVVRGEITLDQYDNFVNLYKPYKALGGNGTGTRLMEEVDKLRIIDDHTQG